MEDEKVLRDLKADARLWLSGKTEEQVVRKLASLKNKVLKLEGMVERYESEVFAVSTADVVSDDFKRYISMLQKELYGVEKGVGVEDVVIDVKECKEVVLESKIAQQDVEISNLKSVIEIYKTKAEAVEFECAGYKDARESSSSNLWRGSKMRGGTEEFYRDVIAVCGLMESKRTKSGKKYDDCREAVKVAKIKDTIVNYSIAYKKEINSKNLKRWLSVALSLSRQEAPKVQISPYDPSKGYK